MTELCTLKYVFAQKWHLAYFEPVDGQNMNFKFVLAQILSEA